MLRAVRGTRVALGAVIGVTVLAGVTWLGANLLTGDAPTDSISLARPRPGEGDKRGAAAAGPAVRTRSVLAASSRSFVTASSSE